MAKLDINMAPPTKEDVLSMRRKILWIGPRDLMCMWCREHLEGIKDGDILSLQVIVDPPDIREAHLHHITYDGQRQSFGFVLTHSDWDIIPDGDMSPNIYPTWGVQSIQAKIPSIVEKEPA